MSSFFEALQSTNTDPESTQQAQHKYRIGLFGGESSGKTCILAALGMPLYRISNPAGFSVTWSTHSNQTGRTQLELAIQCLENKDLPLPTHAACQDLLTLVFNFTERGKTHLVEVTDYSGILLNPMLSKYDYTQLLLNRLREQDAILILAPALFSDDSDIINTDFIRQLNDLTRYFYNINEQNKKPREIPVALLINKWDRQISFDNPMYNGKGGMEKIWQSLEQFLHLSGSSSDKLPPPHAQLYSSLASSKGDKKIDEYQSGDLYRDYLTLRDGKPIGTNFAAFPVSAFGGYEIITNIDRVTLETVKEEIPRGFPMRSCCLEDPFIWAIRRCNELRISGDTHLSKWLER
ncbi:MAG: hypothetical protein HQL58_09500 [Magnetococcales bacterium]|nr:hypothetical protein [Magnetococcales bacterium]